MQATFTAIGCVNLQSVLEKKQPLLPTSYQPLTIVLLLFLVLHKLTLTIFKLFFKLFLSSLTCAPWHESAIPANVYNLKGRCVFMAELRFVYIAGAAATGFIMRDACYCYVHMLLRWAHFPTVALRTLFRLWCVHVLFR